MAEEKEKIYTEENTASENGGEAAKENQEAFFNVYGKDEEKKTRRNRFFEFFAREPRYRREQDILSRIDDEHLMEYLAIEQKRYESEQKLREERGKHILSAFQLAVSLASIVAVIGFLRDEPTVLVNILYIIGIIAGIWMWKRSK